MRKVLVAGGAHTNYIGKHHPDFIWKRHLDFGKRENPRLEWYVQEAARLALTGANVTAAAVEKAYVGNFAGELFDNQGHLGAALAAADPDLDGKPIMRVEGACASGGLALAVGVDAILAGADVVLVVGAEVQTTVNARVGAGYLARAAHYQRQRTLDPFTLPCLFARRAKAATEQTEATLDDLARAAVKARANANRNAYAHMHAVELTFEDAAAASDENPNFLTHPDFLPFLRVSDCSTVSDGASAVLLCSEVGLQRVGLHLEACVEILTCQVATASIAADVDPLRLENTATAARRAYEYSGLGPEAIHVAEVHDCFTVAEVLMYEALGFAASGQGARLLRDGVTEISGALPVNTGGGLVGFGHPVGATGVKQTYEIYRQLKGQCGAYQIQGAPEHGLTANMGGDDRTSVVTIYRNLS